MKEAKKCWDSIANYWAIQQGEHGDWYHKYVLYPSYFALIDQILRRKKDELLRVLDVGCGTGVFTRMLRQYDVDVVGIDFSSKMLEYAKKKKKDKEEYCQVTGEFMSFQNSSFDLAICDLAIQSIKNITLFLSEVSRVIKKNGVFIFSIEHPFFSLFPYTHISTKRKFLDKLKRFRETRLEEKYLIRSKERIEWNNGLYTYRYCRTLQDYSLALTKNGFVIRKILEALPLPEGKVDHKRYEISVKLPKFLIFETINTRVGDIKTSTSMVNAWKILKLTSSACKSLVWLHDTDSCSSLVPELIKPLSEALCLIVKFPRAVNLLCDKTLSNYERAIKNNWVGIGVQPKSSRIGRRTEKYGLPVAYKYALEKFSQFLRETENVRICCSQKLTSENWMSLFNLVKHFIDYLDWDAFITENPRGQVSNLVLEAIELVEAIKGNSDTPYAQEVGDVFYNLIASCLSLGIEADNIIEILQ